MAWLRLHGLPAVNQDQQYQGRFKTFFKGFPEYNLVACMVWETILIIRTNKIKMSWEMEIHVKKQTKNKEKIILNCLNS